MKKLLILVGLLFLIGGCAHSQKAYNEYVKTVKAVAKAQQEMGPMVKLKFTDSAGKPITLTVNQPWQTIRVEQMKDNEWARVVTSGIGHAAMFGGAWVVVDGFKSIAAMNKGNTNYNMTTNEGGDNTIDITNNDSYNQAGDNWQHGDSSEVRTETETTTEANDNEDSNVNF